MKIRPSSTAARLFLLARFEQLRVCDFSPALSGRNASAEFASRISKADTREQCFYLLLAPGDHVGRLYRNGVYIADVHPCGEGQIGQDALGYESTNFSFQHLEKLFPLPVSA